MADSTYGAPVNATLVAVPVMSDLPVATFVGFRQSVGAAVQHVQRSAAFCAAGCCGRVGCFVLGYVALMAGMVCTTLEGSALQTPWGALALFLGLAVGPPAFFLVFLARTFGHAIDRCQVAMSFFTAALMMLPLLALLAWLPSTGLYRATYRLDPACDRCFDALECPGRAGFPSAMYYVDGDERNTTALVAFASSCPGGLEAGPTDASGCCTYDCEAQQCHAEPRPWPLAADDGPGSAGSPYSCSCLGRTAFFAFFRAAFLEESLKFAAVGWIYTKAWVADPRALVLYAAAAAAGFAALENVQYVGQAVLLGSVFEAVGGDGVLGYAMAGTAAARAALSIPLHVGCGLIIGARLGQDRFLGAPKDGHQKRRACGGVGVWLHAVAWPVLFHGAYDFLLMGGLPQLLRRLEFSHPAEPPADFGDPAGSAAGPDAYPGPPLGPGSAPLLPLLLVPVLLAGCFFRARWDYVKLAAVPRVDVRDLQARGVLPRASCRSASCLLGLLRCSYPCRACCGRCRDERDRLLRLSGVYRAAAQSGDGAVAYTGGIDYDLVAVHVAGSV